jgi:hypothetical protein
VVQLIGPERAAIEQARSIIAKLPKSDATAAAWRGAIAAMDGLSDAYAEEHRAGRTDVELVEELGRLLKARVA